MKNRLLGLFFLLVGFSFTASAQLGAGLVFGGLETGLNARYKLSITEEIDIVPQATIFFADNSPIMLGVNAHYNFEVGDGFTVYPLGGLNLLLAKSSNDLVLTLGGGASYIVNDQFTPFAELRIHINNGSDAEFALGTYYSF